MYGGQRFGGQRFGDPNLRGAMVRRAMITPLSRTLRTAEKGLQAYLKHQLINFDHDGQSAASSAGDVFLPTNDNFDIWGGK